MRPKFNPNQATPALKRAAQMPRLFHTLPDEEFDPAKSEVLEWLANQPEIRQVMRQAMFDLCRNRGAIVFRNGLWVGAEFSVFTK
jgi:hypothetical protein